MSLGWFILYLGKNEFFSAFHFPCLLKGSLDYIFTGLISGLDAMCIVGLLEKNAGVFASKFIVFPGQVQGWKTFFRLNLSGKKWIPTKTIYQKENFTGNITKAKTVRSFFCLQDRQNSRHGARHFSNLHGRLARREAGRFARCPVPP